MGISYEVPILFFFVLYILFFMNLKYALFCFFWGCSVVSLAQNPVIAHRGAWKTNNLPQNSIAALRQAISLGCAGSEFDIRITLDDSLVIVHDPTHAGLIIEKTLYQDLLPHKLSNGETIPTLREYLQAGLANNSTTKLVLEIKPTSPSRERGLVVANQTVALVNRMNAQDQVVYISFDYQILLQVLRQAPQAKVYYLEGNRSPQELVADGITGLNYHFSVFQKKPEWISQAKQYGIELLSWTVNDPMIMETMLQNKFEFITTDEPERLLDLIQSKSH